MSVKRVKNDNFEKGERGVAMLHKLDGSRARLDFVESGKSYNVVVDQTGDKPSLPAHVPYAAMKVGGAIQVSATMSKDEASVLFCTPASGEFDVKFHQFVTKEGQAPAPETKQGKKAGTTYRTFSLLMDITEGRWKGCRLWAQLYANFGNADGYLAVSGSGGGSDNLADFLECTCGDEANAIKFSENPLPDIQSVAQAGNRPFKVMVVKGWVDKFITSYSEDAFQDEEGLPGESLALTKAEVHDALKEE